MGSKSASYGRVLRMMSNARRLVGRINNSSSSRTVGKLDKTLTRAEERIGEALGELTDMELSVLNGISYFADADCWIINSAEFRDLSVPIEKIETVEEITGQSDDDSALVKRLKEKRGFDAGLGNSGQSNKLREFIDSLGEEDLF